MSALPRPAVVVTVYPTESMAATARAIRAPLERLARVAAPGDLAVCVHDPINGDERPVLDVVRALGLRLWCAWGANPLVRIARAQGIVAAAQTTERWARAAADVGAEVVEPNGERFTRFEGPAGARRAVPNPDDWVIDAPGDAELLNALAREVIAACRRGAPTAAVSWTSHDILRYHPLPWGAILGPGGVDLHAPQVYASDERTDPPETHVDARARLAAHTRDIAAFVARGVVRADLAPGGAGWTPYGQVHGLTTAGAAVVLDAGDTCRAWALPTRSDEAGVRALQALLLARADTGARAGAVARWQAAHRLDADGVAGPATLAAMGLT